MAGQRPDLTEAWKLLCLNQFHDIVTGTSVPAVYDDAQKDYSRIMALAAEATEQASMRLAISEMSLASVLPSHGPRTAIAPADAKAVGQDVEDGKVLFFEDVPPYSITPISQARLPEHPVRATVEGSRITLSNAHLSAVFENGSLVSVTEGATGREVIQSGRRGNTFLAFEDRPICWDAWDIDPQLRGSAGQHRPTIEGRTHRKWPYTRKTPPRLCVARQPNFAGCGTDGRLSPDRFSDPSRLARTTHAPESRLPGDCDGRRG